MATNNAINVPEGTTGQLLVGVTSAAPAFASSASADFTFTSATAGATRTLTVSNTDNTNSASKALIVASTGGASAGDAFHQVSTTTTTWSFGTDNSVTSPTADPFVISQGTALGTNNIMSVATSGEINFPLQPAFLAVLNTTQNNVTGFGLVYTAVCDTEIFDVNADYDNGTGTLTSPVTGKWYLQFTSLLTGCTIATATTNKLVTSNRTYTCRSSRPATTLNLTGHVASVVDMDAADTCTYTVTGEGEAANTDDLTGDNTPNDTFVSGWLLG